MNTSAFSMAVNWWVKGLIYLCPAPLRRLMRAGRGLLAIEFQEARVLLKRYSESPEAAPETREFSPDDEIGRSAALDWLGGQGQRRRNIVLAVPGNLLLQRKLVLPGAAAANLRQVLAFEMNRRTPFSAEQVYFDYRLGRPTRPTRFTSRSTLRPKNRSTPGLKH